METKEEVKPTSKKETNCEKCGVSFKRQVLIALMVDISRGSSTPAPHECPEGGDHDFRF